ncbi:hypothetical protein MMA231_00940 [Asticcacaulis sp. MM231]|uniref:hypothetical protein n=1 Tax=Asticcacaulis sp. MM231 TaxID=3157666 RepID=UPI0032D59F91
MSQTCKVYTRTITAPIRIDLTVEMTEGGLIDHIEGEIDEGLSAAEEIRVVRAVMFLSSMVQAMQNRGDLIEDALNELPSDADLDVERSILAALAVLQRDIVKTFTGRAA